MVRELHWQLDNWVFDRLWFAIALGCFYAYVKLKEQEIRNLVWICECIVQNQRDAINNFIPIFSDSAPWRQRNQKK